MISRIEISNLTIIRPFLTDSSVLYKFAVKKFSVRTKIVNDIIRLGVAKEICR